MINTCRRRLGSRDRRAAHRRRRCSSGCAPTATDSSLKASINDQPFVISSSVELGAKLLRLGTATCDLGRQDQTLLAYQFRQYGAKQAGTSFDSPFARNCGGAPRMFGRLRPTTANESTRRGPARALLVPRFLPAAADFGPRLLCLVPAGGRRDTAITTWWTNDRSTLRPNPLPEFHRAASCVFTFMIDLCAKLQAPACALMSDG